MSYYVETRAGVDKAAWDTFVDASDEAWLWHRYDLQDALTTWGKRDLSFAVYEGDTLRAVVPLHLLGHKILRLMPWKRLDSLGGPALQNGLGRKHRAKLLDFTRAHLLSLAQQHGAAELTLALPPMAPAYRGERCPRVNPLLALGCENILTQSWVVDLREGQGNVWSGLEKRARNAVRKAEKLGVQVRPANRSSDLDVYYRLHCETYERTGAHPHPKAYFAAIWHDFYAHGYAYILFAELDGEVLAAENFCLYKTAGLYWTGAASSQGLVVAANSLIQWRAMQWMAAQGIDWYETGEAFPAATEGKLKGLNDFKRSFGGDLYPFYRGRITTKPKTNALIACLRMIRECTK